MLPLYESHQRDSSSSSNMANYKSIVFGLFISFGPWLTNAISSCLVINVTSAQTIFRGFGLVQHPAITRGGLFWVAPDFGYKCHSHRLLLVCMLLASFASGHCTCCLSVRRWTTEASRLPRIKKGSIKKMQWSREILRKRAFCHFVIARPGNFTCKM